MKNDANLQNKHNFVHKIAFNKLIDDKIQSITE